MMDETTQEILQGNDSDVSDTGDDWGYILNDLHNMVEKQGEILESIQSEQEHVPIEFYQNINNYMSMTIILNAVLIGVVLAFIFSSFFSGGATR